MENLIFSAGTYAKELNCAINDGIDKFILSKNLTSGHFDLQGRISDEYLQFLRSLLLHKHICLELEDDYGLRLSGRSSTIEIETELWNDFSIEFIDQKLKDYVKMPKEVTIVNDDLSFKRLGNDQLKLFKLHQRNHIVNSYNELDRKDIEYKLLENKFIKLREAKRSLKISNTRLRKSNEAKGNSLQEHQKKSNNQNEDLIQLTIFAERIISTLSTLKLLSKYKEQFRRMWRFLLFVVLPPNVVNGQRNPSKSWLLNRFNKDSELAGHELIEISCRQRQLYESKLKLYSSESKTTSFYKFNNNL